MTTKQAIKKEIIKRENEIKYLKSTLETIIDEPDQKSCPNCETKNYHYYPEHNSWCCVYC